MADQMTFTVIKADCGSPGGHTQPSAKMMTAVKESIGGVDWALDHKITHTGDDIAIIVTHNLGTSSSTVHKACRSAFDDAASVAAEQGNYGAGQDLLATAPSGNVRGTGPGVAELSFDILPEHRPAESIAVFAADKCGPGAYNMALFHSFADPSRSSGFLLSPDVGQGFTFFIEDMDYKGDEGDNSHRVIELVSPEENIDILTLLRQIDRFGVTRISSRAYPDEVAVAVSTDRLHNITGTYMGKDDPVAVLRNQKIFPAVEEITDPFRHTPLITGDARGSHVTPLMPVPINTAVAGAYCLPLVTCLAFSVNREGQFSENGVDIFGNLAWDRYRAQAQERADWMRAQAPFGVTMASEAEISYTGLADRQRALEKRFQKETEETRN